MYTFQLYLSARKTQFLPSLCCERTLLKASYPLCRGANVSGQLALPRRRRQSRMELELRRTRQAHCPPVSGAGETGCTATATLHIYSVGACVALMQPGALLGLRVIERPRRLHAELVQKSPFTLAFCLSRFLLR